MLEIRPTCEHCNTSLANTSGDAMICSFECTYCRRCASTIFNNVCPSCGGNFTERPIRPSNLILKFPTSTKIIHKPKDIEIKEKKISKHKDSTLIKNEQTIVIKRARLADASSISLLGRVTYTESHGSYIESKEELLQFYNDSFSVSKIKTELKDVENLFWIAFSDDLPIGFAKLSLNINPPKSQVLNSCKLEKLYILEDFIGHRIETKMQEILLQTATQLKFKSIWLSVYYKNIKGIKFYKKYGFKETGNIDFVVGKSTYKNLILLKKLKK